VKFAEEVQEAMSQVHVLWGGLVSGWEWGKGDGVITLFDCCFCFDVSISTPCFDVKMLT